MKQFSRVIFLDQRSKMVYLTIMHNLELGDIWSSKQVGCNLMELFPTKTLWVIGGQSLIRRDIAAAADLTYNFLCVLKGS